MLFFSLIRDWDNKGYDYIFVELSTYIISVSLTIEVHKNNLKYKSKTSLLARYSNLFLAPNFGILFIIIVLQYASKY